MSAYKETNTFWEAMKTSKPDSIKGDIVKVLATYGKSKRAENILDFLETRALPISMAIALIIYLAFGFSCYSSGYNDDLFPTITLVIFTASLVLWFIHKGCIDLGRKQSLKEQEASQKQESSQEQD